MAVVIYFTFIETKGLTLEQIEKRFEGVRRSDIADVVEELNGEEPLKDAEIGPSLETERNVVSIDNKQAAGTTQVRSVD
jgi:hypothetical protein